jgi:hypothetical protein
MKNKRLILVFLIVLGVIAYFEEPKLTSAYVFSQDETRGVKPIEYAQYLPKKYATSRPKKKTPSKKQAQITLPKYKYIVENNNDLPIIEGTEIGITIWRLREVVTKDKVDSAVVENTRILKRVKGKEKDVSVKVIPERISLNTPLADGDLVRFAIEVPTEGYIYIISQELYTNGKYSQPYLVFPSRRDVGKTDKILSGKLLFIPNEEDNFQISKLKESGSETLEEVFTIIVAKEPLSDLPPLETDEPKELSLNSFQEWKNKWGGKVFKFEQESSSKLLITRTEKKATLTNDIILSENDLLPQTIYHISGNKEQVLLFTTSLKIKDK